MAINTVFIPLLSMPGGTEWILIIVIVLLMFGGKKIPELMRGLGKGVKEFKDAKADIEKDKEDAVKERESKEIPPTPPAAV